MKLSEMPYCLRKLLTGVTSKQVQAIHSIATIWFSIVWYEMSPLWTQRKHFIQYYCLACHVMWTSFPTFWRAAGGKNGEGGAFSIFCTTCPPLATSTVVSRAHPRNRYRQWNGENTDVFVRLPYSWEGLGKWLALAQEFHLICVSRWEAAGARRWPDMSDE